MLKYTETDKWKDYWFTQLNPNEKLVFIYLYENCDDAGFIDVNHTVWTAQLKMSKIDVFNSLKSLKKALLSGKATGNNILWIRKYLEYQNRLPLNEQEHIDIIKKIKSNINKFSDNSELKSLLDGIIIKKNTLKRNDKFTPPSEDEFKNYYLEIKPHASNDEIDDLYDYYKSCNWKVGKGKDMSDWKAAIRRAIRKNKIDNGGKKSRTQVTMDVVSEMKDK